MQRVLGYARRHGFTRHTSTIQEALRASIAGLSAGLVTSLEAQHTRLELDPDDDFTEDPVAAFGALEARRHRVRGVPFRVIMGLLKIYRQSYLDLANDAEGLHQHTALPRHIMRFFDRVEIASCIEWSSTPHHALIAELQESIRTGTIEKNWYLSILDGLARPMLFVNPSGKVEYANRSACELLFDLHTPAGSRAAASRSLPPLPGWLSAEITRLAEGEDDVVHLEREMIYQKTTRWFQIRLENSLDISGKFIGTAVGFSDITELRHAQAELVKLARYDKLREIEARMEEALQTARRYALPLSLCLCDIDHFKSVNDTHGHQAGDLVIAGFANILRVGLRNTDLAGRYGGDEFCLLLSGTSAGQAVKGLDRIRSNVEHWRAELTDGNSVCVTGSFGVAEYEPRGTSAALIAASDRALYEAKRQGGNRVCILPTLLG
jgi:diguanylate cyclase (GGDEF)-like protein